jgi:enoyl-CoA hydratase/carnithine racemase
VTTSDPRVEDSPAVERVTYRVEDRIAYIALNRPEVLNAADDAMETALIDAFDRYDRDDSAWVAILHGNGRAFTAGADVKARFAEPSERETRIHKLVRGRPAEGWLGRTANWKPIIAAVHGYALGLGLALAIECDLVVASEDATFGITETARGLSGAQVWARLQAFMPSKLAVEMMLIGDRVSAQELYRLGAVNRLVAPGRHLEEAIALAERLLKTPPLAVRSAVRVSRWAWLRTAAEADYYVQSLRLHQSEDFQESTQAFMEKREPQYKGR